MGVNWWEIKNKTGDTAEIWVYEQIGETWWGEGVSAKKLCKEISDLDVSQIDVHINSPGGSVWDGQAIHNALKNHKANVTSYVEGLCASIATSVAHGGNTIVMEPNSLWMIHNPKGVAFGEAKDFLKAATTMGKVTETIRNVYMAKTGMSKDEIQSAMDEETWYTAQEALDAGFVDEIGEELAVAACVSSEMLAQFKHPPESLLATGDFTAKGGETVAHNDTRNVLKDIANRITAVLNKKDEDDEECDEEIEDVKEGEEVAEAISLEGLADDVREYIEGMKAEIDDMKGKLGGTPEPPIDVWAQVPDEIKGLFTGMKAELEETKKVADEASDALETQKFNAMASDLPCVGSVEDVSAMLRSAYNRSADEGDKLHETLRAANKKIAVNDKLTAEIGRAGGDDGSDAWDKLEAKATKLREDVPGLSQAEAIAKVLDTPEGKKLHAEYESEVSE